MESLLWVYLILFGAALTVVLLLLLRSDEAHSRKYAKVRVEVDERSRRSSLPPPDEEGENPAALNWWLFAAALLLILMFLNEAV